MCGLVGVFGDLDVKLEEVFEDLLQMDVIRGWESTGVAVVPRDAKKVSIIKDIYVPIYIIQDVNYIRAKAGQNLLLMGHNRAATYGKVEKRNAHPFQIKNITLSHNGTLIPATPLPNLDKFETDSEAITDSIANIGIEETWPLLNGAATITFWDNKVKTLNIASNGKRPLNYVFLKDNKAIMWASEDWMLDGVIKRHKLEVEKRKDEGYLWYIRTNTVGIFSFKKEKIVSKFPRLKEYKSSFIQGGFRNQYDNNYGLNDDGWSEGWYEITKEEKETDNVVDLQQKFKDKRKLLEKDDKTLKLKAIATDKDDPNIAKNLMSLMEFRLRYTNCVLCKESIFEEFETAIILDKHSAICKACTGIAIANNIPLTANGLLE